MVDLGPCAYYLGMKVLRDRQNRTLSLSQEGYVEKILRDHDMWTDRAKAVGTPMETSHLEAAIEGFQTTSESRTRYQSTVGSLIYAMLSIRLDIAFTVSVVSRYALNLNNSH